MKAANTSANFNSQLSNLKTSLGLWEDLVGKSSKLNASLGTTIQCVAGFLEAFQKISDIAQNSSFGLHDLGMAMTRFCLRQRSMESRMRTFNSQLGDCLVDPLSDRLEEWRRAMNQIDRDSTKELRKAKSELQRATMEAEKLKKRIRRKDSSSSMLVFAHDDQPEGVGSGSNVCVNFAQQDLTCKQRVLEKLERNCLNRVVIEERRRFSEFATCLEPVLDAQIGVFGESGPLEEAILAIQKQSHDISKLPIELKSIEGSISEDEQEAMRLKLRPSPLTLADRGGSNISKISATSSGFSSSIAPPLAPPSLRACGFSSSQLSLNSTASSGFSGFSGTFFIDTGKDVTLQPSVPATAIGSVSTLQSSGIVDNNGVSPPFTPPSYHGYADVAGSDLDSSFAGGDALSLFHAQNIDLTSTHSSSSTGITTNDSNSMRSSVCNESIGHDGRLGDLSTQGMHCVALDSGSPSTSPAPGQEENEVNEETATELTEDDDDDDEEEGKRECEFSSGKFQRRHTLGPAMERSIMYPNQSMPPPVYSNFGQLQKEAATRFNFEEKTVPNQSQSPTHHFGQQPPPVANKPSTPTRKLSQQFQKPISPGIALLRNTSVGGSTGALNSPSDVCGAGEGLSLSPPQFELSPTSGQSCPGFMQARSRIDAMFANSHATLRGIKSAWRQPIGVQHFSEAAETASLGTPEPPRIQSPVNSQPASSLEQFSQFSSIHSACPGDSSTFRRRTAGISRGSMFHLDHQMLQSPTNDSAADISDYVSTKATRPSHFIHQSVENFENSQSCNTGAMTPSIVRRSSRATHCQNITDSCENYIRPPRRSSSVCRELSGLHLEQSDQRNNNHRLFGEYSTMSRGNSVFGNAAGIQRVSSQSFAVHCDDELSSRADSTPHVSVANTRTATVGQAPTAARASQLAQEASKRRVSEQLSNTGVKVLPLELPAASLSRLPQRSQNAQLARPCGKAQRSPVQNQSVYHNGALNGGKPNFNLHCQAMAPNNCSMVPLNSDLRQGDFKLNLTDEIDSTSFIDTTSRNGP